MVVHDHLLAQEQSEAIGSGTMRISKSSQSRCCRSLPRVYCPSAAHRLSTPYTRFVAEPEDRYSNGKALRKELKRFA